MRYIEAIETIREALLKTGIEVYYGEMPPKPTSDFIIWQEEFESRVLRGNGRRLKNTLIGSIHFFCREPYCDNIRKIEYELDQAGINFRFNAKLIDQDLKGYHYEWIFETPIIDAPRKVENDYSITEDNDNANSEQENKKG